MQRVREAKKVCFQCPERIACLEWALDNNIPFGVFGGTTEGDRRNIRTRRNQGAK